MSFATPLASSLVSSGINASGASLVDKNATAHMAPDYFSAGFVNKAIPNATNNTITPAAEKTLLGD